MEYLTIIIRWCYTPLPHINFITDKIAHWYVSRWTFQDRHLTVICVQVASKYAETYRQRLMSQMKNLWVKAYSNLMYAESLETLLKDKSDVIGNSFAVMHTNVTPEGTFYQHVDKIVALVKGHNWTISTDLTIADEETMYRMGCRHEPHDVTVLVSQSKTKTRMISVRCEQPQRIYDLMKKYDVTCSNVWDSTVSLSAKAPCTALNNYNMTIVHVNTILDNDKFHEEPDIVCFYHNMKSIRMQAKYSTFRHNRYAAVQPLPMYLESEIDCVPVALYYCDPMSTLSDVIKADGRFHSSVQCQGKLDEATENRVEQMTFDTSLIIQDPTCDDADESDQEPDCPIGCAICYTKAEVYLNCGHLSCETCLDQMRQHSSLKCMVCRVESSLDTMTVVIPEDFEYKCYTCYKQKLWVANCRHVTCLCKARCFQCDKPITTLQKLFPTTRNNT